MTLMTVKSLAVSTQPDRVSAMLRWASLFMAILLVSFL